MKRLSPPGIIIISLLSGWTLTACTIVSLTPTPLFTPTQVSTVAATAPETALPTRTVAPRGPVPTLSPAIPFPLPSSTPIIEPSSTPELLSPLLSVANASHMILLQRLGQGVASDVLWSPEGKWLAIGTSLGVYLYDTRTSPNPVKFIDTGEWVHAMAFNPDGTVLVTGGIQVSLWEASSGIFLKRLEGSIDGVIRQLAYSAGGLRVAALGLIRDNIDDPDYYLNVWDPSSGQLIYSQSGPGGRYTGITFSQDGQQLILGLPGGVSILDARTGRSLRTINQDAWEGSYAFSRDGKWMAHSLSQTTVQLWDMIDWKLLKTFPTYGEVTLNREGQPLAVRTGAEVQLWDTRSGSKIMSLVHPDVVTRLAFYPDGSQFASVSQDSSVRIWETKTGQILNYVERDSGVYSIAFSPVPSKAGVAYLLAIGEDAGHIHLWDVTAGRQVWPLIDQGNRTSSVAFSPDGSLLVSANKDGTIQTWDLATRQPLVSFLSTGNYSYKITFDAVRQTLITGNDEGYFDTWDARTGDYLYGVNPDTPILSGCFVYGPESRLLVPIETDRLELWDISPATPRLLAWQYKDNPAIQVGIRSIASSADGELVATGGENGFLYNWNLKTGVLLNPLEAHTGLTHQGLPVGVLDLAFNPLSNLLASVGNDGTLKLWNPVNGELLLTLLGSTDIFTRLAFSQDGKLLAAGSSDGAVYVWGIASP